MNILTKLYRKMTEGKIINIIYPERPDNHRWKWSTFMEGDVVKEPILGIFVIRSLYQDGCNKSYLCDGENNSSMLVASFLSPASQEEINNSWIFKPRMKYIDYAKSLRRND